MNDMILSKDAQLNAWDFAVKISKSQMIPMVFRNKPEDVYVTVLYGAELGLAPIMALNAICVIQGQVTLKVQTMISLVMAKDPKAVIEYDIDQEKRIIKVTGKRGDNKYLSEWNWKRVEMLGLDTKDNYRKQPMTMMKARAVSDVIRTLWPDLLNGAYSTEEMQDLPPIVSNDEFKSMAEQDFPIPENEKVLGSPEYRVQNAKFRGKQLKEIDLEEMAEYRESLIKRTTAKKEWETELISSMGIYLSSTDPAI